MIRSHVFNRMFSAFALASLVAGCGGGGGTPGPTATATPEPTPTGTTPIGGGSGGGTTSTAYTCPTSDTAAAVAVGAARGEMGTRRSGVNVRGKGVAATGLVAVTYAGNGLAASAKSLALTRETAARASFVREMTFSHIGRYERILQVAPGTEAAAIATLRQQSGVVSAAMTGLPYSKSTVSTKYFPNDPYYNGFSQVQLAASGDTATPTYHVDPYEESSSVPGQWEMHATRLDYAQEYSQNANGSSVTNAGALGSASVKIAVIDTGEDSSHPELASKIVSQKCFLTNPSQVLSTSKFSVDQDGHGTDVSGIAAASPNNSFGFVGSGGAASIMAYQIFPQPNDSCVVGGTSPDAQCFANALDIASAIMDAANNGANVINLSFGGGTCTNGVDPDPTQGNAIAEALAKNVVVVAAAGNDAANSPPTTAVSSPGCDSGVIAVGASALSDGLANGSSSAPSGSASAPTEYVASYSEYGSPAAAAGSSSAWGIVAPGGDPSAADDSPTATTTDDLHWIENIWTTTPLDSKFAGSCGPDLGSPAGQADCRTLIAGTSQATPLVAGAAALIIAANPSYQSPTLMKQLLCTTAHDIGDPHEGCGRIDIYRAMATAVGDGNLPASK